MEEFFLNEFWKALTFFVEDQYFIENKNKIEVVPRHISVENIRSIFESQVQKFMKDGRMELFVLDKVIVRTDTGDITGWETILDDYMETIKQILIQNNISLK